MWISKPNKIGVNFPFLHPSFSFLLPKKDVVEKVDYDRIQTAIAFIAGYIDQKVVLCIQQRAKFRVGSTKEF